MNQVNSSQDQSVSKHRWLQAQSEEIHHWTDCGYEYDNAIKNPAIKNETCSEAFGQLTYAYYLGLETDYGLNPSHISMRNSNAFPEGSIAWREYLRDSDMVQFDLQGKSILDIAGGPVSLLLRCKNFKRAVVVDPLNVPIAVKERYLKHGIELVQQPMEEYIYDQHWDEIWDYNVLTHVMDPKKIIIDAREHCNRLRMFEVVDTPITLDHPHTITNKFLTENAGDGRTVQLSGNPWPSPSGLAYYNYTSLNN
jgi:2-polyprenyl-3-methyl-5-hydroxy-6-metoxy-1,4-benzoquinol methylase